MAPEGEVVVGEAAGAGAEDELRFFFETSHLDTVVASVRIQTHTYTTHAHLTHTTSIQPDLQLYTDIKTRP